LKKIISTYQDQPGGGRSHGIGDGLSDATASNIMNIINAQENERLILSKELHDGPAQSLTNLILQAEICERLFDKDPMRARTELGNLKEAVNNTFRKIREYIFELRPMILDDLGLTPTLKQYCGDFEKKCSIPCKLSVNGPEQRLPPHIEVTLFRIIQSLLKNVRDHANATHVEVMLDIQADRVAASVIDDGGGFEVDSTMARASEQKKMGLISIQEQVAMLHGEINFDTRTGEGANISVALPLE
jgi:two-component system sensor histidine kinase DegS